MLVPGKRMQPLYPLSLLRWVAVLFNNDYHVWGKRLPSRRKPEAARLTVRVQATHRRTRKNYGVQRLQEALSDHGAFVGVRGQSDPCAVNSVFAAGGNGNIMLCVTMKKYNEK